MTSIVYDAIVLYKSDEEISDKYQVKTTCVTSLVSQVRHDPSYLSKLSEKTEHKDNLDYLIFEVTSEMMKNHQPIFSTK